LLTRRFFLVAILICLAFWVAPAQAQTDVGPKPPTVVSPIANADGNSSISSVPANSNEIEEMKADLARQQKEILDLKKTVDRQQKLIEQLLHFSATTIHMLSGIRGRCRQVTQWCSCKHRVPGSQIFILGSGTSSEMS